MLFEVAAAQRRMVKRRAVRQPSEAHAAAGEVRAAASEALLRLFEPLCGLILDAGLSVAQVHRLLREAAIRSTAARQLEDAPRVNISGIAATTGIPRGEISQVLKSRRGFSYRGVARHEPLTSQVLAAWRKSAKFSKGNGRPADLKIFGRGATFETLVKSHGRGIPTRAMLDELRRTGSIEMLPSLLLRLKTATAADPRITPKILKALGARGGELFAATLDSVRHPEAAVVLESSSGAKFSPEALRLLGDELSNKGEAFFGELREALRRSAHPRTRKESVKAGQLKVSILYHSGGRSPKRQKQPAKARRNLRRGAGRRDA